MGFPIFIFTSFLLKVTFLFRKCIDSLTLKRHNSLQKINNSKVIDAFALRLPYFELKQDDYYLRIIWSLPETDMKINFLNLEN